jgi:GT2 family glycosyltransferase
MDLSRGESIDVAVVVPTLGQRPDYLIKCLRSIRSGGNVFICVVAPPSADLNEVESLGLIDQRVGDPKTGLPAAINFGFQSLPSEIEYIAWLGDDDLLEPNSLDITSRVLREESKTSAVFGGCHYIDPQGNRILTNMSGWWAVPLISFGPDLIPQPGSLMRRSVFESFGGLRTDLGWAFDVDLFINLKRRGKVRYLKQPLASFRWHPESLSVGQRDGSVREASQVRVQYLPRFIKPLSIVWEPVLRWATKRAGTALNNRVPRSSHSYVP